MAENTIINTGTGGDVIATDELTTLNGSASTLVKVQRMKVGFGSDNTLRDVDTANPLPVGGGFVSTVNSSIVVLAASGVFTGTSEDVSQYASVNVFVFTSHASATDGLSMQFSVDGTNWDNIDVYSIPATTGKSFAVQIVAKFFRVVYTNGATLQSSFRMQTIYHSIMEVTSSIRPQDARANDNDMQEVLAHGMLYNGTSWDRSRGDITNGAFVQLKAGNNTAVTLMQNAAVAVGNGTNLNVQGYASAIISITGSMGGGTRIDFEASIDDFTTSTVSIAGHQIGVTGNLGVFTTNTGDFRFSLAGYKNLRARISTYGTGTITARGVASAVAGHGTTVNANIIAALPTGANTIGAVTGAFFQATQPVSLATNTPVIAAGTAIIGKVGIDQTTPGTTNAVTDTKHPASAASADALANPTITQIGADNMVFNGTTWDRARSIGIGDGAAITGVPAAGVMGQSPSDNLYYKMKVDNPTDAQTNNIVSMFAQSRGLIFNGTTWDRVRGTGGAMNVAQVASTLVVTATAAISTAATLTLPAAVGLFHYITAIEIHKYAGAAVVGSAAPVVVTSTNLPGSLAWSTPTAQAIGTAYDVPFDMITALKSSVANTATTIVAPLTTSVIWRITVTYYTAA